MQIYIEEKIRNDKRTLEILNNISAYRNKKADITYINNYRDIFNRHSQNYSAQQKSGGIILAEKTDQLIYKGSPVCQDFGNKYFYYTSCVMNCCFDCEYCFLKGMYSCGYKVIFINLDDIFSQIEEILESHGAYISISYDTDLMAFERITGYLEKWFDFTLSHKGLSIEIRTKCADIREIKELFGHIREEYNAIEKKRIIFAFSLNPDEIISAFEHGTPDLESRCKAINEAYKCRFSVRASFDPMIYEPSWEKFYSKMLKNFFKLVNPDILKDVSLGSFRISKEYLKKMRKEMPYSRVVQFPYELKKGFYQYPEEKEKQMQKFLYDGLNKVIPAEKIFVWDESSRD